ncbi:DNA polymerase zeta catalytic subunit [Termitomyces sp. J132]|nr:DNA polymerase zeta catalytic subunit [Termitomyces sp. J132]
MSLSLHSKPFLRVQIAQIDYSLTQSGSLDNSLLPLVPVIRIFGSSSVGEKTCLHIHQVYPYFFIEYYGKLTANYVNRYIFKLTKSLNHAIALSLKCDPLTPSAQYIRAVLLVKGIHFYGFHSSYSPFLKICIVDPGHVRRAVALLQSGIIMGTKFPVFESQLSFVLQFMCDFGLYGCGWIDVEDVLQRDIQSTLEGDFSSKEYLEQAYHPSPYLRQTCMPIEVDAIAPSILNRKSISARNVHHQLRIPAEPLPAEALVLSVRELWEDERKRRTALGLEPTPSIPVDLSDSARGRGCDWVAEVEYWDQIREKIEADREAQPSLHSVTNGWDNWVMTTFESIEALWEDQWRVWKPLQHQESGAILANSDTSSVTNDIARLEWDAPDDSTGYEDIETIDVDVSKLSQEFTQLMDPEKVDLGETDEEETNFGVEENEDELHQEVSGSSVASDPFDVPEHNSSQLSPTGVGFRFSSPPERSSRNSDESSPTTPTRIHQTANSLWPFEPDDNSTPVAMSKNQVQSDLQMDHKSPEHLYAFPDNSMEGIRVRSPRSPFSTQKRETPPLRSYFSSLPSLGASHCRPSGMTMKLFKESYSVQNIRTTNMKCYEYSSAPPSLSILRDTMDDHELPAKIYQPPHYSSSLDIPERPKEYAGLVYRLKGGHGITHLDPWDDDGDAFDLFLLSSHGIGGWEYSSSPPSNKEIRRWLVEDEGATRNNNSKMKSQIQGATPANIYGFEDTPGPRLLAANPRGRRTMSILALEIFAPTREGTTPNAELDSITALSLVYQISEDVSPYRVMILIQTHFHDRVYCREGAVELVESEIDLINRTVDIVGALDPDIVTGWDIQRGSWGYLNARSQHYGFDLCDLVSRAPPLRITHSDQWEIRHASTFKVAGRHALNLWRLMRSECKLQSYSLENVIFNFLQRRVPCYSNATLSAWYHSKIPSRQTAVLQYFAERTFALLEILNASNLVTKTAEFARVFGVDFFSVISRGSQFKVESFMFRIAKSESFVLLSPSRQDVGRQNAAECMPLIMEPASSFYTSPLVVLDFQSLYPSIMIAYNYCYSTCLGRVKDFQGRNKLGVIDLELPPGLLASLSDHIQVAPNGMIYVKSEVRKGLLGRMLIELLGTRVMVKQAMKSVKNDKALRRVLDARQLGLKYIANVTYGYTSATFSGRMPAVEIADSIVQSGRETLEKAIMLINSTKKWGAEVVYGDTDSIFAYLRGKTKAQAFRIGQDIADTITALNPAPVKLKFEKVFHPCVLMAKKRYVGFKYESVDDKDPVFDAKGIETVRRDGIPAQQKMVEVCLKMLFRAQDLSAVKKYCCMSWTRLLENKVSIQDFIFAKEVRMGTYSDQGPPPPGVVVAAKRMLEDPMNEPQYGERVPYVITRGPPGARLVDRAVDPLEMLNDSRMQLDAAYYITRVLIPPLERIFNLVGADVRAWFNEMPKPRYFNSTASPSKTKWMADTDCSNIEEHFYSSQCLVCGDSASQGLCDECYFVSPQETIATLSSHLQANEQRIKAAHQICATCCSSVTTEPILCESLDCPWMYSRKRAQNKKNFLKIVKEIIEDLSEHVDSNIDDQSTQSSQSDEAEEVNDFFLDFIYRTP